MNTVANVPEASIRVLKSSSCPSLTGKSKLTYQVGSDAEAVIHFRIVENSATGAFSQDWVSLAVIQKAFTRASGPGSLTSYYLHALFAGKSVNTPAFLLAALKAEGLVQPSTTTKRCHEWTDGRKFAAVVEALMASDGGAKVSGKSAAGNGKQTAKARSAETAGGKQGNCAKPATKAKRK